VLYVLSTTRLEWFVFNGLSECRNADCNREKEHTRLTYPHTGNTPSRFATKYRSAREREAPPENLQDG